MQQRAAVKTLLPDGRAVLTVARRSACSGDCHTCGGCGAVEQTLTLTADNPVGAVCGDIVYVESAGGQVLGAAALVYLLPLLLFLAGYLVSLSLGGWAAAIGGACFALGLVPAVLYNRRLKKNPPRYTIAGFVK